MTWRYAALCIMFFLAIIMLAAGEDNASGKLNASYDWMKALNPDDYSLQAEDLHDPFIFMEGYTKVDRCVEGSMACAPFTIESDEAKQSTHIFL